MDHSNTLIVLLQSTFQGSPWHGKSVMTSLSTVTEKNAIRRINKSYNIAELVAHMIAWRRYTLALLTRNYDYKVGPADNFPNFDLITSREWENLKEQLSEVQQKLLDAIKREVPSLELTDKVPGKSFSWLDLLHGLIHHDLYHTGQINLLQKFG